MSEILHRIVQSGPTGVLSKYQETQQVVDSKLWNAAFNKQVKVHRFVLSTNFLKVESEFIDSKHLILIHITLR